MDEIFFRLSSHLESLQIQASVTIEHAQHLLGRWLSQGQRLVHDIRNDFRSEEYKEFFQQILAWFQKHLHSANNCLSYIEFNPKLVYQHIKNLYKIKVTNKELIYFAAGLLTGAAIGYTIALNYFAHYQVQHMKAIVCQYYFGIQGVLMVEDVEMPVIRKSNELLIEVKAASLNEVDIKICSGYSKTYRRLLNTGKHKSLPVILGRDCAGVVVDIGNGVTNFDIGDKVFLAVPSWSAGTMAEYIVISETQVVKMPKVLPFEASASLPYSGCIAWDALVNSLVIKEGDATGRRVLVYGGSTSVGCILIQLIRLWGGHVVTICRSKAAHIIKALGADEIIEYNETNIYKELELHDKFDAIFFTGGMYTVDENIKKYLLPNGCFVSTTPEDLTSDSFGYLCGTLFAGCIKVKLILQYVFGVSIYHWKEGVKLKTTYLQSLQALADADQLQPILDKVYVPHSIDQALSHVTNSDAIGSTVITFQKQNLK